MPLTKVQSRGTENVGQGSSNLVINGAMNVAQRATSQTGLGASEQFVCDRWKIHGNSSGRLTATQDSSSPLGFANSLKLDCTTADTSIASNEILMVSQGFEGQNLQSIGKGLTGAKELTVSFYVKASGVFTFAFELYDADNGRHNCRTFATTTDWVRHSFVIQADEDDGSSPFDDDNLASMYLNFWLHSGTDYTSGTLATNWANYNATNRATGISSFYSSTDNNFFLTGVQIEVGSQASDFQHEDIGTTLQRCQRYYHLVASGSTKMMGMGDMYTTSQLNCIMHFPVQMRAVPSLDATSGTNYYTAYGGNSQTNMTNAWNLFAMTNNVASVYGAPTSSVTAGTAMRVFANNASAYIAFSAEL